MDDKVPCCAADASRKVRRIKLVSGAEIGIVGLEAILCEVRGLGMSDEIALKAELLGRVKANNYVPRAAEEEYAEALYREYLKATVKAGK